MKPILLLHGALGSEKQFDDLKLKLEHSRTVLTLNFEGHGGKPFNGDYSIQQFTENVIDFLTKHNYDKMDVFGYSMGGYVAIKCAIHYPQYIGNIITLGTKFDWNPEVAALEVKRLNPEIIEAKVPRFAQKLNEVHYPTDWKAVVEQTAKMMVNLGNGDRIASSDLEKIEQKVLVLRGTEDEMVSREESAEAVEHFHNAVYKEIEGCPHPLEKVDMDTLTQIILESTI